MELSLADQYYLKALDAYPWNLEFVIENVQYAISYDDEHVQALCLMGKLQMYKLKDYKSAKYTLNQALKSDLNYPDTYKHLSLLYLWLGQYDKANKLINYDLKLVGIDHCLLLRIKALAYEYQGRYQQSKQTFRQAKVMASHSKCMSMIDDDIKRIKAKQKFFKSKKKRKKGNKRRK